MASDVNHGWGALQPGEILIAEDDFALILAVSRDGWPEEWMWMSNGHVGSFRNVPTRHLLCALFEGRAIMSTDGHVRLCQRSTMGLHPSSIEGWSEMALEWWRAAAREAGAW